MGRALQATPGQVERAKALYETFKSTLGFRGVRPQPSRHAGGDLGETPWERLPIERQEGWVLCADAVARKTLEQERRGDSVPSLPAVAEVVGSAS